MTQARSIVPDNFAFTKSFVYLSIAVVGGVSSLGGAIAAALLFGSLDVIIFRFPDQLNGWLEVMSTGLLAFVLLAYNGGLARAGSALLGLLGRSSRAVGFLSRSDRAFDTFLADMAWLTDQARRRARQRLVLAGLVMPEPVPALAGPARPADVPLPVIAGGANGASPSTAVARLASTVRDLPVVSRLSGRGSGSTVELLEFNDLDPRRRELPPDRADRPLVLEADGVVVRFGGLVAVNDVSLEVREGEIVGLIGPNGAGKSVTFNSIAGIVTPTSGRIRLHGHDVTDLPVHERAQLGVARTFQAIQLIPQLSVFDNLLVATHLQNPTGFLSHISASEGALYWEGRARDRVRRVVQLLDMRDVADEQVADLPFGVLRMVEVARAMVTGFRFMMLDEPASGLDNAETERLTEVLMRTRDLGVTLLLIEHDVKMVTSMSDYMYVLERGQLIAQGVPEHVQRDPAVVAAYLGQPVEE
jgi:ABC-type branched-subunit amino acid transport system ATPase component